MNKHMKIMALTALLCTMGVFTGCDEGEVGNESCSACETMTDSHDGQVYRTIKIGNQVWMAENLKVVMENSWCYENKPENCQKYGRLYTWDMANGACPEGWRLPSKQDFDFLLSEVGGQSVAGKMLKSKKGWKKNGNGSGDFEFMALPAGIRLQDGKFLNLGEYAYFWTSTLYQGDDAYNMYLDRASNSAFMFDDLRFNGRSVRCIKAD